MLDFITESAELVLIKFAIFYEKCGTRLFNKRITLTLQYFKSRNVLHVYTITKILFSTLLWHRSFYHNNKTFKKFIYFDSFTARQTEGSKNLFFSNKNRKRTHLYI